MTADRGAVTPHVAATGTDNHASTSSSTQGSSRSARRTRAAADESHAPMLVCPRGVGAALVDGHAHGSGGSMADTEKQGGDLACSQQLANKNYRLPVSDGAQVGVK